MLIRRSWVVVIRLLFVTLVSLNRVETTTPFHFAIHNSNKQSYSYLCFFIVRFLEINLGFLKRYVSNSAGSFRFSIFLFSTEYDSLWSWVNFNFSWRMYKNRYWLLLNMWLSTIECVAPNNYHKIKFTLLHIHCFFLFQSGFSYDINFLRLFLYQEVFVKGFWKWLFDYCYFKWLSIAICLFN